MLPARMLFMIRLFLSSVFWSLLTLSVGPFDPSWRWLRRIIGNWARSWFRAGRVTIRMEGREHLEPWLGKPLLLVGNHQSSLDIPLLTVACDGLIRYFAKRELFFIPFTGWGMRTQRCIPIYRDSLKRTRAALDYALDTLQWCPAGVAVFPEGTRTRTGDLLPYHRGTFNLAKRARVPVIPFTLDGAGALMPPGELAPRPGEVRLVFGPAVLPDEIDRLSADELMERTRAWTAATLDRLRAPATLTP
jgi:1-acyl-sn-glycerol-3-phosphate acyltransferase